MLATYSGTKAFVSTFTSAQYRGPKLKYVLCRIYLYHLLLGSYSSCDPRSQKGPNPELVDVGAHTCSLRPLRTK